MFDVFLAFKKKKSLGTRKRSLAFKNLHFSRKGTNKHKCVYQVVTVMDKVIP